MTQIQNGNFDRTAFIEKKNDFFCDIIHKKNSFIHTAKANDCGRKKKTIWILDIYGSYNFQILKIP